MWIEHIVSVCMCHGSDKDKTIRHIRSISVLWVKFCSVFAMLKFEPFIFRWIVALLNRQLPILIRLLTLFTRGLNFDLTPAWHLLQRTNADRCSCIVTVIVLLFAHYFIVGHKIMLTNLHQSTEWCMHVYVNTMPSISYGI